MEKGTLRVIRHFRPELKKHRWLLTILMVVGVVRILMDLVLPFLLKRLVDGFGKPPAEAWGAVSRLLWILLVFYIVIYLAYRSYDYLMITFQLKATRDLQLRILRSMMRHSYRFFANSFSGSLVSKAIKFRNALERMTDLFFWQFLAQGLRIPAVFCIFLWRKPALAMVFLVWAILFFASTWLFVKWKTPIENEASEHESRTTGILADDFGNINAIKSFSTEELEFDRYKVATDASYKSLAKSWYFHIYFFGIWSIFVIGFEWILIYLSAQWWRAGAFTPGDFMFMQANILVIFRHVWDMGFKLGNWNREVANANEAIDIIEAEVEVRDRPGAKPLKVKKGEIRFEEVTFRYEPKANDALKHFSLTIKPGEKVALVGHSGSGKSTVVKLLYRFFDPQKGRIEVDGQDIRKVTQESLRKSLAMVPQDPNLFHRTLGENLAYGSTANSKEILEAAEKAHIIDFVQHLPAGFETMVGERGIKLSGGEKQRIAIARAILRNSEILVLDEATSSLDSVTEQKIQAAIADIMRGRTTLVIAHRLSTIRTVDRVVVLEKGEIVEQGTHGELIQKNGPFAKLWNAQVGGFID